MFLTKAQRRRRMICTAAEILCKALAVSAVSAVLIFMLLFL